MRGFLNALQFLTRIPVRSGGRADTSSTVIWFPVVGALVGAVVGGVAAGLMELVPATVAAALAVVVGMLLTGAFHEDGLADTADALGGWSPEQRQEILTDSRHGSFGVAAMCSTILVRTLCLAALGPAAAFGGAVAAHSIGRGTAVGAMGWAASFADEGLGSDHVRSVSRARSMTGLILAAGIAAAAIGWWMLPSLALALVLGALVVLLARRAFGGINGDVLGATEQTGEVAVLVVVAALADGRAVWWA